MRTSFVRATLSFTFLALLFAGCTKEQTGSDVLAKVNGEKITRTELDREFNLQIAGSPKPPSGDEAASLRLNLLNNLIETDIRLQRAQKLNLSAGDEEVDAKFNELKAPYTQEEFDQRMKERNLTVESLKSDLRKQLTLEKLVNKEIVSKINITDGDIKDYFEAHKAEYNLIEPQYHLAQIVVTTSPAPQAGNLKNDKARNAEEAQQKVRRIMQRLETGEDFAQVAMDYSEQPETSPNGGDMGLVPESSIKQASGNSLDAISKLRPGQFTQPLPVVDPETKRIAGYRIIRMLERLQPGQRDLNDPRVQASIRQQLRERRGQLLQAAYYESLRNEAKVENFFAQELLKNTGTPTSAAKDAKK
jgi:peptidyl-prolyl cis-trans isomerase SurA